MLSKKAGISFNFVLHAEARHSKRHITTGNRFTEKKTFIFLKREYKLVHFRFVHFVVV